eukprot:6205127-Pleurochrysis_carterae.AAC.1
MPQHRRQVQAHSIPLQGLILHPMSLLKDPSATSFQMSGSGITAGGLWTATQGQAYGPQHRAKSIVSGRSRQSHASGHK